MKGLIAGDIIASPYRNVRGAEDPAFVFFEDRTEVREEKDAKGQIVNFTMNDYPARATANSEIALGTASWLLATERGRHELDDPAAYLSQNAVSDGDVLVASAVVGVYFSNVDGGDRLRDDALDLLLETFGIDDAEDIHGTAACCRVIARTASQAVQGMSLNEIYGALEPFFGEGFASEAAAESIVGTSGMGSFRTARAACFAFLNSTNYSQAVRYAVLLGGNVTSIAAIAGYFNEVKYGTEKVYLRGQNSEQNITEDILRRSDIILDTTCDVRHKRATIDNFVGEVAEYGLNLRMARGQSFSEAFAATREYEAPVGSFDTASMALEYQRHLEEEAARRSREAAIAATPDYAKVNHGFGHIEYLGEHFFYLNDEYRELSGRSAVTVTSGGLKKGLPYYHPDTAFLFTDNAQAYMAAQGIESGFDNTSLRLNVSDVNGTNSAGIRTDKNGKLYKNSFGLVVRKMQQDAEGKFLYAEGNFNDTEEDFELFKRLNTHMLDRLQSSGLTKVVVPQEAAFDKTALPSRFVFWLMGELDSRLGLKSRIEDKGRDRFALTMLYADLVREEGQEVFGESFKDELVAAIRAKYGETAVIKNASEFSADMEAFRREAGVTGTVLRKEMPQAGRLYYYQGSIENVFRTTAPEVNERIFERKSPVFGEPSVYVNSVFMRGGTNNEHSVLKNWILLKEACKAVQAEQQKAVGYAGPEQIHFGSAFHLDIQKNEIRLMEGDNVHAVLYVDQISGHISKRLESEGLEHYQVNRLLGVATSNRDQVVQVLRGVIFDEETSLDLEGTRQSAGWQPKAYAAARRSGEEVAKDPAFVKSVEEDVAGIKGGRNGVKMADKKEFIRLVSAAYDAFVAKDWKAAAEGFGKAKALSERVEHPEMFSEACKKKFDVSRSRSAEMARASYGLNVRLNQADRSEIFDNRGVEDKKKETIYYEEPETNLDRMENDIAHAEGRLADLLEMTEEEQMRGMSDSEAEEVDMFFGEEEDEEQEQKEERKAGIVPAKEQGGNIFVTYYGSRNVPTDAVRVQISTTCPKNMKKDMDYSVASLYPDFSIMVQLHKEGVIDDAEYTRRYQEKVLGPNRDKILKEIQDIRDAAVEQKKDVYLFCYCAPGSFCHRYLVNNFLNENKIACQENPADRKMYSVGHVVLVNEQVVHEEKAVDMKPLFTEVSVGHDVNYSVSEGGYQKRTYENANAPEVDFTIAFAAVESFGERATAKAAGNSLIRVDLPVKDGRIDLSGTAVSKAAQTVSDMLPDEFLKGEKCGVNLAGNGLYTLVWHEAGITQEDVDVFVTAVFLRLKNQGLQLSSLRSGGQTGVDESVTAVGSALDVPVQVHAPKGWEFRGLEGDRYGENAFKGRFDKDYSQIKAKAEGLARELGQALEM